MNPPEKTKTAEPIIVAAMTRRRVIGDRGRIPWDLPADRRLFRQLTWGHCVIMGRLTYQSLPQALPGRTNLVLSHSLTSLPGCEVLPDLPTALQTAAARGCIPFVIGGVRLYQEALPLAAELVISWVEGDYPGNRLFPSFEPSRWVLWQQHAYPGFTFCRYRRP